MRFLGLLAVAAGALAVVQLVSPAVRAEADDRAGTTVRVGPDAGAPQPVDESEPGRERRLRRRVQQPAFAEQPPVAVSRYWIGLGGEPLPAELRAHLDVDQGEGLLVRTVAADGPAGEAGVQVHDIILRANGKPIGAIDQLADEVGEQGEMRGRVTLDLMRGGKPKTLWVAPVERPMDAVIPAPQQQPRRFGGRERGRLLDRERLFGGEGLIGPEMMEGLLGPNGLQLGEQGLGGLAEMMPEMAASSVSVSVRSLNGGPQMVTVQQGDKTWEFELGDQDALNALPADIRPMVQGMLNRTGQAPGQDLELFGFGGPGFQLQFGGDMADRMQALQQRMQALRGQLGAPAPGPVVAPPPIHLDEAPAFNADEPPVLEPEVIEEPIEIEIPNE